MESLLAGLASPVTAVQVCPFTTSSGPSTLCQATNNTVLHLDPSTAQAANGNVYIFWDQNPGISYITTNTNNIANDIWPSPVQYTQGGQQDYGPAVVALKNGTIMLFLGRRLPLGWGLYYSRNNGGVWSPETLLANNPPAPQAVSPTVIQDAAGKIWVAWTRNESGDLRLRFVDINLNGAWDLGEPILYDTNDNNAYDSGEPIIYGGPPAGGSLAQNDPRVKFFDANGDGIWESGEFVAYDPNLDNSYDPKLKFIDSNSNNVWDQGETIAYDVDSNDLYAIHTGIKNCTGSSPVFDCLIVGNLPSTNNTIMRTDSRIRIVDSNTDGVWQPGETLVYDRNNNGVYDTGEQVIAALSSDVKLKFVGSGATWVLGNPVVYDSNSNGIYDSAIKFVDTNANGHWDPGETVVYDSNLNGAYDFFDYVIFEAPPPGHDLGKQLKNDAKLRFFDSSLDGVFGPGESVTYDSNLNNIYDGRIKFVNSTNIQSETWTAGKPVVDDSNLDGKFQTGRFHNDTIIAGSVPANNTALRIDPLIEFNDRNGNSFYDSTESLVYDSNGNQLYDSLETTISGPTLAPSTGVTAGLGEVVITKGWPTLGTGLKTDGRIKFVDSSPQNNLWDPPSDTNVGEDVVYDFNNTGTYAQGDPMIYSNGTLPGVGAQLKSDSHLKYADSNTNNVWDSNEPVIYDGNLNNLFDSYELVVSGVIPVPKSTLVISIGEPVAAAPTPAPGSTLKTDSKIRFYDKNANTLWNSAEPVEYDSNDNSVFDSGDIQIQSTPVPNNQTPLKLDETSLSPLLVPSGSALAVDSKIKFADGANSNLTWDPGETVVYDSDANGVYSFGTFHNDTIIAGAAPAANQTSILTDSHLKYINSNGNTQWDTGESVAFDSNLNGSYDSQEPVAAVFSTPSTTAVLRTDTKIKIFDTNANGILDVGESVVYDLNNNGTYDSNETTISGPVPLSATPVATDSHVKYVDSNSNSQWNSGEQVVYDSNNNGIYDSGETPIASGFPLGGTPLRVVAHIFYKIFNGTTWSADQRLTTLTTNDHAPSMTQTRDGKIWVAWGGDRTGPTEVLFRTTSDGVTWTPETVLYGSSLGDSTPSIVQDRNGMIWIVWVHNAPCNCGQGVTSQTDLYTRTSADNGSTWSTAADLTQNCGGCATSNEVHPSLIQMSDKNLYVFFPVVILSTPVTANLYYMTDLVQAHSAKMNAVSASPSNLRVGQTLVVTANVTNNGDYNDSFTINVMANATIVATNSSVLVLAGQTMQIIVKWVVLNVNPGHYVISANVIDPGETIPNQADNAGTVPGTILIRPSGDVNGDCVVNIVDLVIVAGSFGKSTGDPGFNPLADLNNDGNIDILDLSTVGTSFGKSC